MQKSIKQLLAEGNGVIKASDARLAGAFDRRPLVVTCTVIPAIPSNTHNVPQVSCLCRTHCSR